MYFIKKVNRALATPWFLWASELDFKRRGCVPCPLVQKTSYSGLSLQDTALGHDGNHLYIYLADTSNVFLLKKRIEGTLCQVLYPPIPAGRFQVT